MMDSAPLLDVQNLVTGFRTEDGPVRAVDDVSFQIGSGKTLAIVGESGCGKSVTALSIMRLIPDSNGAIESGRIQLEGEDLLSLPLRSMRNIRGNRISMIFQEPMTALNPVMTIGKQIMEVFRIHRGHGHKQARAAAKDEDKAKRKALWKIKQAEIKERGVAGGGFAIGGDPDNDRAPPPAAPAAAPEPEAPPAKTGWFS